MSSSRVGNRKSGGDQYGNPGSRGSPDECVSSERIVIGPLSGSLRPIANAGRCLPMSSSSDSLPASHSCITATDVNSFEIEQML